MKGCTSGKEKLEYIRRRQRRLGRILTTSLPLVCPLKPSYSLIMQDRLEFVVRDRLLREIVKIAKKGPGRTTISELETISFDREWFEAEAMQLKEKVASLVSDDTLSPWSFSRLTDFSPLYHSFLRLTYIAKTFGEWSRTPIVK